MPLVYAGSAPTHPVTPTHERARKVDPAYTRGEPVRVAYARNQAESDLLQNILLEEGIPSMARRTRGFDVPDFLAAGPRDVLVPESGAEAARDVLRQVDVGETIEPTPGRPIEALGFRIALAIFGGGLLAALVAWLLVRGG
jgi:hypothetical protein